MRSYPSGSPRATRQACQWRATDSSALRHQCKTTLSAPVGPTCTIDEFPIAYWLAQVDHRRHFNVARTGIRARRQRLHSKSHHDLGVAERDRGLKDGSSHTAVAAEPADLRRERLGRVAQVLSRFDRPDRRVASPRPAGWRGRDGSGRSVRAASCDQYRHGHAPHEHPEGGGQSLDGSSCEDGHSNRLLVRDRQRKVTANEPSARSEWTSGRQSTGMACGDVRDWRPDLRVPPVNARTDASTTFVP